jgi:GTP-binding protein YchF
MNLGIIGLPQVGKRSIFGLLTGTDPEKAPTRDGIRYGIAPVRDPRIDLLSGMYNPKRTRYAEFEIALPPDVQPNAARGAAWIDPIRKSDALLHVVRAFDAPHVFHIEGSVDPERDIELVNTEFLLADLALTETRLTRIAKEQKSQGQDAARQQEKAILERCMAHLEDEQPLRTLPLTPEDQKVTRSLQFLTRRPVVVAFNVGEDLHSAREELAPLTQSLEAAGNTVVFLSAAIEAELDELDAEEQAAFMEDLALTEPAAHRLSRAAYEALGLMSFFTVGPDEVRAWPVQIGASAPEAAGKIHSDLERGFIRAETIHYDDLIAAGSEKAAREAGKYKLNGKDYTVRDGDIMEIRFSV